jgi:hypothetical protein
MEALKYFNEDWKVLMSFLPQGWTVKARELGALTRTRNIKSVNVLLRILLIHLADGRSLRETSAIAKQGKLASVSDVALLKRMRNCSDWLNWMSKEFLRKVYPKQSFNGKLSNYNLKSVDASVITEPGSTGTDWRLHYCIDLQSLKCDQFNITKPNIGESFKNFKVEKKDLFIGDRAYGRLKGLSYIKKEGGDFIVRMKNKAFSISRNGKEFNLLEECNKLKYGEYAEFDIKGYSNEGIEMDLRLCVIKKSKTQGEAAIKKAKRGASKGRRNIGNETLELQRYIIILSSLPKEISTEEILDTYRYRWQIEIAFKRLKSILGLGHLPKIDEESCKAWLNGKIFVAMLAQAIVDEGQHFSPWGYPTK